MSDSGDDSPTKGRKRSSFASKFDKFSTKLPNPFKKSHSDSDDEGSVKSKSPEKSPNPSSLGRRRIGDMRLARNEEVPDEEPPHEISAPDVQATITPVTQAIPVSNEASAPAVVPPLPARTATSPAKHAPAATVPKALPATPVKEATAAAKPPASPAAPRASAAPVAPGAGEAKAGNTPADAATAATAAAAAVSPRKEYDVVGGPVSGVAEIVLTGVKGDPEGVIKKIRRRGFVVHLAMLHDETLPPNLTLVLALGPKLQVKAAVERNLRVKSRDEYTSNEMSQLLADAVDVIQRSGIEYGEVNLLHNKEALKAVSKFKKTERADAMFSYFGPYVGLYFAWLSFYIKALVGPTVAGIILFLFQWNNGTPDDPLLPAFCILLMMWTMGFVEIWKRRNASIAFKWGVDGVEDEERMRVSAEKEGDFTANPVGKYCVTVPIILTAIYVVIRSMLYCIWLSDNAVEVYGVDSYQQYIPLLLYSVVPIVAATLYGFLAKALNDFEEHTTAVRKKNMLVIKMFAFQFVNSYCALFYVAFWLKDLKRLRSLLTTMLMVKQFISQIVEKYQPVVMSYIKNRKEKKNPPMTPRFIVKHTGTVTAKDVFDELKADPTSMEDDYLEMVLQFGYLAMFGSVFPLAPLFAMLNNLWEIRLDLSKLLNARRPQAHAESTIGAWQLCLEMIAVLACLTNLLMVLLSKNVDAYVPASLSGHMGSLEGKVVLAVVVEHVLLLLKTVVFGAIDRVPVLVRNAQSTVAIKQKEERMDFRKRAAGLPASTKDEARTVARRPKPSDRLRALHTTYGVWNFGPMWYMPLAFLPFLVSWFELTPFLVIPIAFVFVSYLQHVHDKANSGLALGIVKNPKVLKMVTEFMPPWYTDSEVERVQWLNKIVNKMWVSASAATRELCFTTIQPILDQYRPSGVSALGFKKVSLGTVPPKIVGMRALEMKGDKAVIDIDIRWAANAEIVLEAGVKPIPLLITLDKIRFSGKMRVELAPLVPTFPCFGALVVTFMEKPFLDFAFSLGKLDVMSIGPGDANIGAAVSNVIKGILDTMMVFPNKMVVPILLEQDMLNLAHPTPTGVVELTLVGADKLKSTDLTGKSDPYVKIKVGGNQEVKTDVKDGTLNPRWNQTFDLISYERSSEIMKFTVFDRDTGGDDDLGCCELPLSLLTPDMECSYNLVLSNVKTGSLLIKATYVPLVSGPKNKLELVEDEIVGIEGDDITDDTVAQDAYTHIAEAFAGTDPASAAPRPKHKKAVDPSKLAPTMILTDKSMGVLSVMGIECKGVKKGDSYVTFVCGNTKRKTPVERKKTSFAYADVFHFLIRGATSAVLEVLLMEDEKISKDKTVGSFKIYVNEVLMNEDQLDGEWDLRGEKAQGSIKMRLKWAGRVVDEDD